MPDGFAILEVPLDAPLHLEQMGSKEKFWFRDPVMGKCLFKAAREGTGEDWAEKVVAELCQLLGLPHARYELASWGGKRGVVTPCLVSPDEALIHGNEFLGLVYEDYPRDAPVPRVFCRVPQHTIDRVLDSLRSEKIHLPAGWPAPEGFRTAADVFVGYLLVDAWIGNTDRHHENWAVIAMPETKRPFVKLRLAPTFDHASCLGRELNDEQRSVRLMSADARFSVEAYASRARSALYLNEVDSHPLTTLDALLEAARRLPTAAQEWTRRLEIIREAQICDILAWIPREIMTAAASEFALRLLCRNRERIRASVEGVL